MCYNKQTLFTESMYKRIYGTMLPRVQTPLFVFGRESVMIGQRLWVAVLTDAAPTVIWLFKYIFYVLWHRIIVKIEKYFNTPWGLTVFNSHHEMEIP